MNHLIELSTSQAVLWKSIAELTMAYCYSLFFGRSIAIAHRPLTIGEQTIRSVYGSALWAMSMAYRLSRGEIHPLTNREVMHAACMENVSMAYVLWPMAYARLHAKVARSQELCEHRVKTWPCGGSPPPPLPSDPKRS